MGRFWDHRRRMIAKLHSQRLQSLEEIRAFLAGSSPPGFEVSSRLIVGKSYYESRGSAACVKPPSCTSFTV